MSNKVEGTRDNLLQFYKLKLMPFIYTLSYQLLQNLNMLIQKQND